MIGLLTSSPIKQAKACNYLKKFKILHSTNFKKENDKSPLNNNTATQSTKSSNPLDRKS